MAYNLAIFVVILITHASIFPVKGQTTVQGCDNDDSLFSIAAEKQQLRVELFDRLEEQVHSIHQLLKTSIQEMKSEHGTAMTSLQVVDRRLRELDHSIQELHNESLQETRGQHSSIVTNLEAFDRRLQEHDISMKNLSQNLWTLANGKVKLVKHPDYYHSFKQLRLFYSFLSCMLLYIPISFLLLQKPDVTWA